MGSSKRPTASGVAVLALLGASIGLGSQPARADSKAKAPGVKVTFSDVGRLFLVDDTDCADGREASVRFRLKLPKKPVSATQIVKATTCDRVQLANGRPKDVPGGKAAVVYYRACSEGAGELRCSKLKTYQVPTLKDARARAKADGDDGGLFQ